ncbi:NAD(P)-dependent oxidoreductase [Nocardioides psychrotolerans]|uniref:dTDP-4-dehydrorhamnose reductase n=1 Tax=Nocardioides psychrotolerans TaxID=1005945 RepID=A0A1I3N6T6_9ACTN|nr:NAD(P)-dependent oxidoreductase [Nocardioides psychrotolerans]GEP40450.1 NAD(P)-dependent oxidoreductase [Nocardioides psychrotolerans]SFJ04566.1 dTDP-4-dehydrorhamnose reductase [Nocardioides psychrotolerans]
MKVYVAGSGGMLGHAVHKVFSEKHDVECSDIDVNDEWLSYLDFRDFQAYDSAVTAFQPDLLIHLGAHTSLEYCEENKEDAYLTNTVSVEHAATLANKYDVPLVYISTAGIFDGQQLTYDDWDKPNPLGVYARSKYLGEVLVQQRVSRHFICRAGWMMGGGPAKDKKFIMKIMKQLKAGATELSVVDDKLGTPTYTIDFATNLEALATSEHYGLYNMVCGGETGRFEVAVELVKALGLADSVKVVPVNSDHFKEEYFAPRPPSERLINYKLDLLDMNLMRDWRVSLAEYVEDYFDGYLD